MTPLLVLRPQPGADATAERIRARGLVAVVAPLFERRPVAWDPPSSNEMDHLLVTSAAVFEHGGARLNAYLHLPMVAVGHATAAAARTAGFGSIEVAEGGNVRAAAERLTEYGARRVLHLAGEDRIEADVPGALVTRIAVYAATPVDPPPAFHQAIDGGAVALVHSPRAGGRLASLVADRKGSAIAAISAAAAAAAGAGWRQTVVAENPTDEAVIDAAAALVREE